MTPLQFTLLAERIILPPLIARARAKAKVIAAWAALYRLVDAMAPSLQILEAADKLEAEARKLQEAEGVAHD